jgi:hypothetical protein
MGLSYDFKVAKKRRDQLNTKERESVLAICREIYEAERTLTEKAAPILARCMVKCKGLCCQNILPADIITEWDLLYILLMAPQVEMQMEDCIQKEDFFSQNCIFLENATGPCIFPDNIRPERCIISFCNVEPSVEMEIARVMNRFSHLIRYYQWRPLGRMSAWLKNRLTVHRQIGR